VFLPNRQEFSVRRGPIFTPVLLADEINRAPAKVQSALLEAMEERQVTIGEQTLPLPEPFLVMATQNPIELDGTYPLPEAQIDRFLLKLVVPYPSKEEELEIVERDGRPASPVQAVVDAEAVAGLRVAAGEVHVAPEVSDYAVRLARATREPEALARALSERRGGRLQRQATGDRIARSDSLSTALLSSSPVALGASPRASIYMVRAARARALLDGRRYTTPHDVKRMAPDVLRHRVLITYEAEADGVTPDAVLEAVLASVEIP
jgi:MoxR-like ATPase